MTEVEGIFFGCEIIVRGMTVGQALKQGSRDEPFTALLSSGLGPRARLHEDSRWFFAFQWEETGGERTPVILRFVEILPNGTDGWKCGRRKLQLCPCSQELMHYVSNAAQEHGKVMRAITA